MLIDGVSDTVGDFNGIAISPPQDSVREFKVVSGAVPAEYGRTGSSIVSFVTKSGTDKFHGALYDYFQNGDLNANGWQRNRRGVNPDGTPVLPTDSGKAQSIRRRGRRPGGASETWQGQADVFLLQLRRAGAKPIRSAKC